MPKTKQQFCKYGHDTFVTGRNQSHTCNVCQLEQDRKRRGYTGLGYVHKKFCVRGHDIELCGRIQNGGRCRACYEEEHPGDHGNWKPQRFCSQGHDKDVTGRVGKAQGCLVCSIESSWRKVKTKEGHRFTLEDYNQVARQQGNKCALCQKSRIELKKNLAVDHDHITGHFRALLCSDCNINVVSNHTLESATKLIDYLRTYS